MQPNENTQKFVKIIVFALLCAEMSSTLQREQSRASNFKVVAATTGMAVAEASSLALAPSPLPYYASIRLIAQERRGFGAGHICAGALVAPSAVLTVASCVRSRHPAELRVVLGSSDHYTQHAHTLSFGITHVRHGPSGLDQLALLLLERDVPTGETLVQPLLLPQRPLGVQQALNATQMPLTHCGQVLSKHYYCMQHDSNADWRPQDAGAPLLTHNGDALLALKLIAGNAAAPAGELYVPVGPNVAWLQTQIGDGSNKNDALWGTLGFMAFTVYAFSASGRKLAY